MQDKGGRCCASGSDGAEIKAQAAFGAFADRINGGSRNGMYQQASHSG